MKRVSDWNDIRRNLIRLDQYRTSPNKAAQDYFRQRIRLGHCFVVCTVSGGRRLFGPSRFIGYADNTRGRHERNEEKHGSITNGWIESVMKAKFRPSAKLEAEFQRFCEAHGIEVSGRHRRYIAHSQPVLANEYEEIQEDLDELKQYGPTEKRRLTDARIGQGKFRASLEKAWRGRCAVTGCRSSDLLRASHIKPWRDSSDQERLDPFNGLLLSPNVDAAFDKGLVSIDAAGWLIMSSKLGPSERKALGLRRCKVPGLNVKHHTYLDHHRRWRFIK